MARTNPGTKLPETPQDQAEVEAPQVESANGEAAPETEATEAPAETAEGTEEVVNLQDFKDSVQAALDDADKSTGEPTDEGVSKVQDEYRKLEKPGKTKARDWVKAEMRRVVKETKNITLARGYMTLGDKLTGGSAKGEKAERKPADPTQSYVETRATLFLATALQIKPEGLAENADDKAQALYQEQYNPAVEYVAWLQGDKETRGDEPEVSPVIKTAAKLAIGKRAKASSGGGTRTSTYEGPKRNTGAHIKSAFAGVPSGTFLKVADIVKHVSAEYGDDHPSPGAISAKLKSVKYSADETGARPETRDKVFGAVKV